MLRKFFAFTLALLLVGTIPLGALAEEYDLVNGSITVEAKEDGQYVSQENGVTREKQTTETVIKQTDSDTNSTTNTITIKATGEVTNEDGTKEKVTAEVTISDVNIDVSKEGTAAISAEGDGNVTIELEGDNVATSGRNHAGVEKNNDGNLTITDADADGALEAAGGFWGAGIGGGYDQDVSNITIEGGDITAIGREGAAGIGGGGIASGSHITIKGDARVKATGGENGAGIGGGASNSGSNITIEDNAQVDATGSVGSAGIGSGKFGSGSSNITIRGNAQVSVKGGFSDSLMDVGEGAGIGDGGGWLGIGGSEVAPNTDGLTAGSITYYAPDADKSKDAPEKLLHKTADGTMETHTGVTLKSSTAATCLKNATVTYQCGCGAEITTELLGTALGHALGNYTSNNDATCTADGTKTAKCIRYGKGGCQESKTVTDEDSMLKHDFDPYVPDNNATCTENGTETAKCAYGCGTEDTREIPNSKLPHDFENYVYQDNATCESDGTEIAQCEHCDATDERVAAGTALGHSFTHYVSNNDATYDSDGTQTAECDHGCGATDTIPAPGTRIPLYRVVDAAGRNLPSRESKDGTVLTITAEQDHATLTGTLDGIRTLQQRGITTIVFVTNHATSTFDLANLTGTGSYALTHDGEEVTFTLNDQDVSSILK